MNKFKQPQVPMESEDFFETMPMSINETPWNAGSFAYRDDASIDPYDNRHNYTGNTIESEIKTTAIITLVLVLITAVALGLLIWRGLGTNNADINKVTDTTSYEL